LHYSPIAFYPINLKAFFELQLIFCADDDDVGDVGDDDKDNVCEMPAGFKCIHM